MYRVSLKIINVVLLQLLMVTTAHCVSPEKAREIFGILRGESTASFYRSSVYGIIKPYVNKVPYAWGGTSEMWGMDCSGFTKFILEKYGVSLPRTVREQSKLGVTIAPKNLKTGDLLFFKTSMKKSIDHVGIYLGNGIFAHSEKSHGVILSRVYTYRHKVQFGKRIL